MRCCFLILLLTLIAPLLTFAQEPLRGKDVKALRLKAKSDAKKDADKDMRKPAPFITGMGSVFASGACLALTFRALPSIGSDVGGTALTIAGCLPIVLALQRYDTAPHPPIERLIGKHPEYVKAYVDAYTEKMRFRQLIGVSAGAAAGCGLITVWAYTFGDVLFIALH
ncbi:MAG: hypothetical protein OXI61_07735 [Candidatus Poribacteria bacterium]|nr:hypothetical protein [Candidatus Poribacteria bacterium]